MKNYSLHSLKNANCFKFPKTWILNIKSFWRLILIREKMTHFTQFEFEFLSIHIWCFFHYLIIILLLIHSTSLHLAFPLILSSSGSIFLFISTSWSVKVSNFIKGNTCCSLGSRSLIEQYASSGLNLITSFMARLTFPPILSGIHLP